MHQMKHTTDVTEAHRWWHVGTKFANLPEPVETTSDDPTLHDRCASPFSIHGDLDGESVCPGMWITLQNKKVVLVPHDLLLYPTAETLHFVMDCKECDLRTEHESDAAADAAGVKHTAETRHAYDIYEVVNETT